GHRDHDGAAGVRLAPAALSGGRGFGHMPLPEPASDPRGVNPCQKLDQDQLGGEPLPGSRRIEIELTPCRVFSVVIISPRNTCPRCESQRAHRISVRTMPSDLSSISITEP